jgi:hypothetical protein
MEADTLAHVLYRSTSGVRSRVPWSVERMPLSLWDGEWRLLLNHDIGWLIDLSMLLDRE